MIQYFENRAKNYSQKSQRGIWRILRTKEYATILQLLDPKRDTSLIDFGCGAGFYSIPMRHQYGLDVLAVDSAPAMLLATANRDVKTHLADIETLGDVGTFDNGLAAGVFEFIKDPTLAFRNCWKALKPGANLVVLVPRPGVPGAIYKHFHQWQGCPVFVRTLADYQAYAHTAGFSTEMAIHCTPISAVIRFRKSDSAVGLSKF